MKETAFQRGISEKNIKTSTEVLYSMKQEDVDEFKDIFHRYPAKRNDA